MEEIIIKYYLIGFVLSFIGILIKTNLDLKSLNLKFDIASLFFCLFFSIGSFCSLMALIFIVILDLFGII